MVVSSRLARCVALGGLLLGACGGAADDGAATGSPDAGGSDAQWPAADAGADAPADGAAADAAPAPTPREPCGVGQCWSAPAIGGLCGLSTVNENFATGKYDVHGYALAVPGAVTADLTVTVTGGAWDPALIVLAQDETTLYDGEVGVPGDDPQVTPVQSGHAGGSARVQLTPKSDLPVEVFVTGWSVVDGGFAPALPPDAEYSLTALLDCPPPTPGTLLSPPNFDPTDVENGFYLLPPSEPPGLYTRKPDDCSRGTKLLIDVIYTVATYFKPLYPALAPISVLDLNEGSCSNVDHATHDDGTHVDIVAGCATDVSCADKQAKIALAKLFVDTGAVCGILNNDTAVHAEVNDYFAQQTSYAPWKGQFMRSVTGHDKHFHVRVKKPDGTCN